MAFGMKMLSTLEYGKITERLASLAATEGAKARARALLPSDDFDTVLARQEKTEDARRLVNHKGYPSFSAEEGTVPSAERAYKGAVLSPRELMDIASLLYSTRMLVDYIHTDKPFATSLDTVFERLIPNQALEQKIRRAILSEDLLRTAYHASYDD